MRRAIALALLLALSSLGAGTAAAEDNPCQLDGDLVASTGLGDGIGGTGIVSDGDGLGGTGIVSDGDGLGGTGIVSDGDGLGGTGIVSDGDGLGGTGVIGDGDGLGGTGVIGDGDGLGGTGLVSNGDGLGGTGLVDNGDGLGGTGLDLGDGIGGTGLIGDGIGGTGILGTITRFGSICVNGLRVHYDESAAVELDGAAGDAGDLAIGQVVWVEAAERDGRLQTERIRVLSAASGIVTEVDLEIDQFRVGERIVEVPPGTPILDGAGLEALATGERVVVSGLPAGDRIVASRVDRADGSAGGEFSAPEPWLERAASLDRLSLEGYLDETPGAARFRLGRVDIDIDTSLLAPALAGIGSNSRVWLGGKLSKDRVLHVDRVSVRPTRLRGASLPRDATRARKRARKAQATEEPEATATTARPERVEPERAAEVVDTGAVQPNLVSLESPASQALLRQLLATDGLDDRRRSQLRDLIESGVISVANGAAWADSDQLETRLDELVGSGETPAVDPSGEPAQGESGADPSGEPTPGEPAKAASTKSDETEVGHKAERKRARRQAAKEAKRAKRDKRAARAAAGAAKKNLTRTMAPDRDAQAKPDRPQRTARRESAQVDRPTKGQRPQRHARTARPERPKRSLLPGRPDALKRPDRPNRINRTQRPQRFEKPNRPDRPKRIERPDRPKRIERPDRPERLKRPERPKRIERPDRPKRIERPKRPERIERPERPKRPERVERPKR